MFIRTYKRKYKDNSENEKHMNCFSLYFQLVKSYREKGKQSRHKVIMHLGRVVLKNGYSERYSKKVFLKNLRSKLKNTEMPASDKEAVILKVKNKLPEDKLFAYDETYQSFETFELRYKKYLKNHTLGELLHKLHLS